MKTPVTTPTLNKAGLKMMIGLLGGHIADELYADPDACYTKAMLKEADTLTTMHDGLVFTRDKMGYGHESAEQTVLTWLNIDDECPIGRALIDTILKPYNFSEY